jgi:BirA family biotin operon repressor/biotin-[acetyl-CoA-carboxylase] ligase
MNFVVEWYERLGSTNTHLRERARRDCALEEGLVVATFEQTCGRGRGNRIWNSAPGENLTFSILLRPEAGAKKLASLPIATAVAVSDLLAELNVSARLKWPNDVLVGGRKICGILSESLAGGAVVLGVGLNVNMPAGRAEQIDQPATSLKAVTGCDYDLHKLIASFLAHFSIRYTAWAGGGFEPLRSAWESLAQRPGEHVSRGVIAGYGADGELLVRGPDGNISDVWTG